MTSFINVNYPAQHQGANRVESAIDAAQHIGKSFSGTRGLATLLLSAVAAAVMVVADQVMDSVAEGHLLMMWIALWAVAFAALALFAGAARQVAVRTKSSLDAWSRSLAEARADQRLWAIAKQDSRVMADLQLAMMRKETLNEATSATPAATTTVTDAPAVKLTAFMAQPYTRYYI